MQYNKDSPNSALQYNKVSPNNALLYNKVSPNNSLQYNKVSPNNSLQYNKVSPNNAMQYSPGFHLWMVTPSSIKQMKEKNISLLVDLCNWCHIFYFLASFCIIFNT
jgi:hypothetical protein